MEIFIQSPDKTPFPQTNKILQSLNTLLFLKIESLTLHLLSDEGLLKINKEYLQHDYYTDIITFDLRDEQSSEVELFLSFERIKENATLHSVSEEEEFYRVCIHGMLHLSGMKDKTASEQKEIRIAENKYLEELFHVKP